MHFCSWRKLLQISASLAHTIKLINESLSCIIQALFKLLFLYWVLDRVINHYLFKSKVLVSYSSPALLELSLTDFQNQAAWGLVFPVQVFRVGMPNVGLSVFAPHGEHVISLLL